jgi:uncharacterized RDD family membrane protein YckC
MKCPKCGYLGFETTDRCRNCQYDFSLAPFQPEPDLLLQTDDRHEGAVDFDLPPITKPADALSSHALDLDRLFGEVERKGAAAAREHRTAASEGGPTIAAVEDDTATDVERPPQAVDEPPLAVRRSTPEVPRNRPRTTRPVRPDSLSFEPEPESTAVSESVAVTMVSLMESPSLGVRIGAGLIDLIFLVAIDLAVLYLTLRITGLQNTLEDLKVLPPIPFAGFLAMLAFGYLAAFTVAGGQTIGKMLMSLRVIGDDGRPVDPAGALVRAAGCLLVPVTFGLSYVPALVTSDHRALHDRLAGTRVVRE